MDTFAQADKARPAHDRRRHPRFAHPTLTLRVRGIQVPALDISEGGIRIAIGGLKEGQMVALSLTTNFEDGPQTVETAGKVVAAQRDSASISFAQPTYKLMRFIIHYLARYHGVAAHAFR